MITGFENITYELTELEKQLVPVIIKGMHVYQDKNNAVKGSVICSSLKISRPNLPCTEARLRKIVNYIRTNGLAPIMATSKGYYLSNDKKEIETQIESLTQRANGIMAAANGLRTFIYSE